MAPSPLPDGSPGTSATSHRHNATNNTPNSTTHTHATSNNSSHHATAYGSEETSTTANTTFVPEGYRIYAGTFNINGRLLTEESAALWLRGADTCHLVVLAFQEALQPAVTPMPVPENAPVLDSYIRGAADAASDEEQLRLIHKYLAPDAVRVADVSMGEPPTFGKRFTSAGKEVEWYGYVRTIVFATPKVGVRGVRSFVVPVGASKPSCVDEARKYTKNSSPDKGAVSVFLEGPDLLVINSHLAASNKYNIAEVDFEVERFRQLHSILHVSYDGWARRTRPALEDGTPKYLIDESERKRGENETPPKVLLLGDLNFRVEVHPAPEQKNMGGDDWQAAVEMLEQGRECELFTKHDRLLMFMKSAREEELLARKRRTSPGGPEANGSSGDGQTNAHNSSAEANGVSSGTPLPPEMELLGYTDCLTQYFESHGRVHMPTFTMREGRAAPRRYWEKRTPSWTDRVLVRGFTPVNLEMESLRTITISDHEPVYAIFGVPEGA